MKTILSSVFLFFALSSFSQQTLLDELAGKWTNASDYTLEVVGLMPDSAFLFKPTEEQKTFRGQVLHTAANMIWLSQNFLDHRVAGFDFEVKRQEWEDADYDKAETMRELKFALNFAHDAITQFDPAQLDEVVEFFAGPMTKRQILLLLHDHHTHHRAQMIVYLRLQGITPPKYRGW